MTKVKSKDSVLQRQDNLSMNRDNNYRGLKYIKFKWVKL